MSVLFLETRRMMSKKRLKASVDLIYRLFLKSNLSEEEIELFVKANIRNLFGLAWHEKLPDEDH
jgi:hypothetical protein